MDTPEQKTPPQTEQAPRKRLFEGIRERLARRKTTNPTVTQRETAGDERSKDEQRIEQIQELLQAETSSPLPSWAEKHVPVDSINLRTLPIDWQALSNMGKAINDIKDDHLAHKDLADIKPPSGVNLALPMVASVIAHSKNEEIPISLPTELQVKAMKPWLNAVEKFIGRFSPHWARSFDRYIEKKGGRIVTDLGNHIVAAVNEIGKIENPRQQFLHELTLVYHYLGQSETEIGFWGEENERKIESKIYRLLHTLKERNVYKSWPDETPHWLNNQDFPLLLQLLPKLNLPPFSFNESTASVAGAELMEGIELFLRQHGIQNINHAPLPGEVDLFDPGSWMRGFAETFAADKLDRVKQKLPELLSEAYRFLPDNGRAFTNGIYTIAENICILSAQGTDATELARHIFVK